MTVHTARLKNNSWTISHNASRLALSREWGGGNDVINFDQEGRPWNLFLEDVSYQRRLDNRISARWVGADQSRQRRWLGPAECLELVKLAHQSANRFLDLAQNQPSPFKPSLSPEARAALQRAAAYDPAQAELEAEQFQQMYLPGGILPPDLPLALLVQASSGCPFDRCPLCQNSQSQPFHARSAEQFRQHARAVRHFLGAGVSSRRALFLGDAHPLQAPMDLVLTHMAYLHELFDVSALGGIHAFIDDRSRHGGKPPGYQALAGLGLVRGYLDLGSGHEPLRRLLNMPGQVQASIEVARGLKSAGISLGLLLRLGAGGHRYSQDHVRDSVQVLQAMELEPQDQLYFIEPVEQDPLSSQESGGADLEPLSPGQLEKQWQSLLTGLQFALAGGAPPISRCTMPDFFY
jgi:hypothetical protein